MLILFIIRDVSVYLVCSELCPVSLTVQCHMQCKSTQSSTLSLCFSGVQQTYRKISNTIRTIFTKNRGPEAGVRIIHLN